MWGGKALCMYGMYGMYVGGKGHVHACVHACMCECMGCMGCMWGGKGHELSPSFLKRLSTGENTGEKMLRARADSELLACTARDTARDTLFTYRKEHITYNANTILLLRARIA